ncbi:MAG: hypothetical protein ABI878_07380 [Acidobacteriota bacterium]
MMRFSRYDVVFQLGILAAKKSLTDIAGPHLAANRSIAGRPQATGGIPVSVGCLSVNAV